jgi:hypothetical protein
VTIPVPLGRNDLPTKLSMTELLPELCKLQIPRFSFIEKIAFFDNSPGCPEPQFVVTG